MVEKIGFKRLEHAQDLPLPELQTQQAAGFDLVAAIDANDCGIIAPMERLLVPTGLSLAMPENIEAQVRPRSGLALHHGITLLNSPGTIDADYRGEIKVLLINFGDQPFKIARGMRIAQLIFSSIVPIHLMEVSHLDKTERGSQGFGSTGL